jgi:hypothetical protein
MKASSGAGDTNFSIAIQTLRTIHPLSSLERMTKQFQIQKTYSEPSGEIIMSEFTRRSFIGKKPR